MKKIEIVSASAGSGKTTRIATELRRRIASGTARPEAVLATTFTNKAADELKERARTELFRAGLHDEALRLEGARIGTVNSVCGRLVTDFAFELGLSPELRVIDEDQAAVALRGVMGRVVTESEREELSVLSRRFEDFSWQSDVSRLLTYARTNRLTEAQLRESGARSARELLAYLPAPVGDPGARDLELREVIEAALTKLDPGDETKLTRDAAARLREALGPLQSGPAPWKAWAKAMIAKPSRKSDALFSAVREVAVEVDTHPRLHADLQRAIELVFELTTRTLTRWQEEKRALGVIDFVDQETLALELVSRPDFEARLSEQLDLVLVDEFQDTSPLQLALFTRLAQLAKASVWVGDQKQAIFGFRGTDPALMDAALEAVLQGAEPETLQSSFRSRRPLVDLTSALFEQAFAPHGIPAQRVRLSAPNPDEPRLGPCFESWTLKGKNRGEYLAAIATGVREVLADESVLVRDRLDGSLRRARAGDLAVLCRRNFDAQALAAALSSRGIPATVSQTGLMRTPEARAAVLALRLFIDPRERLAAAELARLLLHPDEPDTWLARALERTPDQPPFADAPFHRGLEDARGRFPAAGPLAALDAALDGLGLWDLLPRWGDSSRRQANLDALRAHAVDYVSRADAEGSAATPAGLVAYFEVLGDAQLDAQAQLPGADAVVVSTWHAAKGLEWPITVLALLGQDRPVARFGFAVRSTKQGFSLDRPLEGRWVRYWPNPFHSSQTTELRTQLEQAPEAAAEQAEADKQELRLLYVGWTRARDRLVLAEGDGGWMVSALAPVPEGDATWAGVNVERKERLLEPGEVEPRPLEADEAPIASGPRTHPPAFVSPSTLEGEATEVVVAAIGERLPISTEVDMNELGQALHGFLAVDRVELPQEQRVVLAREALSQWGQAGSIRPARLVESADALTRWGQALAPGATWHREWPVSMANADGSQLRGIADLVLEDEAGFWLVDHKSFPGSEAEGVRRAKGYAGQLRAYADVLTAALGKPCRGLFIHLVVLGRVVQIVK